MSTTIAPTKSGNSLKTFLEMIKFEHSIFALPYAMIGMMWSSVNGWPGFKTFGLILVAMVGCRTAAMAFNRIVDRDVDAINDRTKTRAIPAGLLSLRQVHVYFAVAVGVFVLAAAFLNPSSLWLSPVALFVTLYYSRTKRHTHYCHLWLGASLGIAPVAAGVAVTGRIEPSLILLFFTVMFWTAGFDIIYSLQDEEFDKANGLHSVPVKYGRVKALKISRRLHIFSILCMIGAFSTHVHLIGWAGVIFAAVMLYYEQSLVKADDLSRVNMAFFTLNGAISVGVFVFALLDRFIKL
jgi:4-hydroxybenzoate polyprenyltransferase